MHDVVFVEHTESLNNLTEIGECNFLRETAAFLEEGLKGSAVAVLIYEVEVVDSFEHIEVFDDVG
jgi:hypothetical protein